MTNRLSPVWLALVAVVITPGCGLWPRSPIINGVSPNAGLTSGGTSVTITGANFRAGATVLFGGAGASSVTVASATQIQAITPAHAAGTVDVTVRNADGQSSTLGSSRGFIYTTPPVGPPRITSISPNSATPGTQVTINGANFAGGAAVAFGGTSAVSTIFVSSTQLISSVPIIGTGVVDVKVTNPGGPSATLRRGFTVVAPQSLLAGMTPGNLKVPSGWTLVATQDFEGSIPSGQYTIGEITATRVHSGTHSLVGHITGDSATVAWGIFNVQANEYYLSYFEYDDTNATVGQDFFFNRIYRNVPCCNPPFQEVEVNGGDGNLSPGYISPTDDIVMIGQAPHDFADWAHSAKVTVNEGIWVQYEFWMRGNSCSGSTANNDGFYRFFKNGRLLISNNAINLTGCPTFNNDPLITVQAAGVASYNMYTSGTTTAGPCACVDCPGRPDNQVSCAPFSACPRFQTDGVTTCWGSQAPFNRYIDDVIVLRK